MNKKLREISLKSELVYQSDRNRKLEYELWCNSPHGDISHQLERFTNLLIQSCVNSIMDHIVPADSDSEVDRVKYTGMIAAIDIIKKEFGVN